jgi:hypothetical protein
LPTGVRSAERITVSFIVLMCSGYFPDPQIAPLKKEAALRRPV